MYQVRILDQAGKELGGLDKPIGRRIVKRLGWMAEHFDEIKPQSLTGDLAGLYKLRVGDFRVIYEILASEATLLVHAIGHRREIYRRH